MTTSVVGSVPSREATVTVASTGGVAALFLGGLYLLWAVSVVSGAAQSMMDIIARLHFIRPVYVIQELDPLHAFGMVLLSMMAGYAFGGAFAILWNRRYRSSS